MASTPLSDVVTAAARSDVLRREVRSSLVQSDGWRALDHRLDDVEAVVQEATRRIQQRDPSRLRYDALFDADMLLRERERSVKDTTQQLESLAGRLERDLESLDAEIARWPDRLRAAAERGAPQALLDRARSIEPELETVRNDVRKRRDEVLVAFDRGSQLRAHLASLRALTASRRDEIGRKLRVAEEAPIWAPSAERVDDRVVATEFALARQVLASYLRNEGLDLLLTLAAVAIPGFLLLRRPPLLPAGSVGAGERMSRREAVAGGILVALVTVTFLAPTGPTAFYPLWWFPIPLLAAWVARHSFRVAAAPTLWALAFAGCINTFRTVAELEPGAERLLFAAQTLPLVIALVVDWRRGTLARQFARLHLTTVRALAFVLVAALMGALGASFAGWIGHARVLRGATITALGSAVVFAVFAATVDRMLAAALATPIAQRLRSVREQGAVVRRFVTWVVWVAVSLEWLLLFLYTQNLIDPARQAVSAALDAKISVRDVDLTAGSVLLAAFIAAATVAAIRLLRFLLTVEILPRFGLRPGVPIAVATLASYVVAVIGFVLVLAALGVDLTKVTLLAGALGVGIGFGLQNIVNNFVSGLILVLERPVNVGDQIQIGELLGDVRRIGIRSSTVRTVQGAEVIVPNSELVSKQLVNWTLSDRSRRYEIDVGVAYGSDPDRVMRLLEEAASEVPEVKKAPPPRVLFAGFGDSSLDFRVLAWAESVDVGLQAQNNLRRAILAKFTAAGVEIPYPQRDLNVRMAGPPPPVAAPSA